MARRKRGARSALADGARRAAEAAAARPAAWWRAARARMRPWRPEVAVDVAGRRGRRLRRTVERAAAGHLRALGVAPPERLLVAVQRTVVEGGRPLEALLQLFEDEAGRRRHVLFVALSVEGRSVGDREVVATLRQQLQAVALGQLGELRLQVAQEPVAAGPRAQGTAAPGPAGPHVFDPAEPPLSERAHAHANGASGAALDLMER
ncbi:MAG: hypothetical protein F4150_02635 [Chloroflexi bacterium]|nr:hypothetical protein [Chloroflexota bacterium]